MKGLLWGGICLGNLALGAYRFGFQGQEQDDEVKGAGNSVNYKYRVHDPRLGKFLNIDPLAPEYPFYSPYAFSGNRVIDAVELEGKEPIAYDWANAVSNTFLRVTNADDIILRRSAVKLGLDPEEFASDFQIRWRTRSKSFEDGSIEGSAVYWRQAMIEPKSSLGWEIWEGVLDLLTIWPQGKAAQGKLPSVLMAEVGICL